MRKMELVLRTTCSIACTMGALELPQPDTSVPMVVRLYLEV